jgi:hypothetical protein
VPIKGQARRGRDGACLSLPCSCWWLGAGVRRHARANAPSLLVKRRSPPFSETSLYFYLFPSPSGADQLTTGPSEIVKEIFYFIISSHTPFY